MSKPRRSPGTQGRTRARARAGTGRRGLVARTATGGAIIAIVAVIAAAAHSAGHAPAGSRAGVASLAPDGGFTTTTGLKESVSSLRGGPTLLWFVTRNCGSCQAGTQAMAAQIRNFAALHVRVVELDLAYDGGGPLGMSEFARQLAGRSSSNPDWTFGVASEALTRTYDAPGYQDIYYLLDSAGRVTYANSGPADTMSALLSAASRVGSRT